MAWSSILPADYTFLETWAARIFILLGILTIGPWVIFVVFDFLLYVFRCVSYEIPFIGGRARGRQRPRAPSLKERPDGRPRSFSIAGAASTGTDQSEKQRPERTQASDAQGDEHVIDED
ncbi:MAG: hypothetical protein M1833_004920 [Piccolia ochrophora]|nr:MAG: hypothetical protein M1833_004920 [Piccolia ochrophora]